MKHHTAIAFNKSACVKVLTGLILSLNLFGCHADEFAYARDPEGVNRLARPQVILKKGDVYIDGRLIRIRATTALQAKMATGKDPSEDADIKELFDSLGLRIHATENTRLPGHPNLVHFFEVFMRQEDDSSKRLSCNEEDLRQHHASIQDRLIQIEKNDLKHGWGERVELKAQVRNEVCSMPGKTPEHAFPGYLEVDGIPIGPNMSLAEIQARRKHRGLEPLYENSSPQIYLAPKNKTGPFADQTWIFEVTTGDGGVVIDQRLKSISVP